MRCCLNSEIKEMQGLGAEVYTLVVAHLLHKALGLVSSTTLAQEFLVRCVCACAYTFQESGPSTTWVPEIELRKEGLASLNHLTSPKFSSSYGSKFNMNFGRTLAP